MSATSADIWTRAVAWAQDVGAGISEQLREGSHSAFVSIMGVEKMKVWSTIRDDLLPIIQKEKGDQDILTIAFAARLLQLHNDERKQLQDVVPETRVELVGRCRQTSMQLSMASSMCSLKSFYMTLTGF